MVAWFTISILLIACIGPVNEDQAGSQPRPPFNPKPSPAYLSPEESMKTFQLPEGYKLELVASEPMICEPVAIAWDGNGRLYVAEMLTYMQDADATGEREPRSRITLLEDTDWDGKMDKHAIFIDSLLLPRMLQCVNDELLVNETNTIDIVSYRDTDGDGKADKKRVLYKNDTYVTRANIEHQRSGLDWNLDNWMYLTYDPVRFRYIGDSMQVDTIHSGAPGQWGMTHDNYGRLFYSSAGGENPALGFQINPRYGALEFPDQLAGDFQAVWPVIATPDVEGGRKRLRPDNTLNHFTGACGQSVYRGDRLPPDLVGDYIICEPVGRVIRRAKVFNEKGKTILANAYERQEFIASSDMNFRPVNSATGPDGSLYLVDMHRGVIQQGTWTRDGTFLRKRIDSLGLAKNTGHGRIYRVVHEKYKPGTRPNMLSLPASSLLAYLDHPNGWWRDQAQKQIIALGDMSVVNQLKKIARGEQSLLEKLQFWNDQPTHLARIHALWTLEGLRALNKELILSCLDDEHAQVRRTAIWICERYIKDNDEEIMEKLGSLRNDENYDVRVQLVSSLYSSSSKKAKAIISEILRDNTDNEMLVATGKALERNAEVRSFINRLGNIGEPGKSSILRGESYFKSLCASCHGLDGKGMVVGASLAAPSLEGSARLAFDQKNATIRILLHGLTGPIDGKSYTSSMPPMEAYSDAWIADVANYVRYEFGKNDQGKPKFSPVIKAEEVKAIREKNSGRKSPWSLAELGL